MAHNNELQPARLPLRCPLRGQALRPCRVQAGTLRSRRADERHRWSIRSFNKNVPLGCEPRTAWLTDALHVKVKMVPNWK